MKARQALAAIAIVFATLVGCSKRDNSTGVEASDPKAAGSDTVVNSAEKADFVLTNGKVYTVNEKQPWAEAVAVKGNKIAL
jgi:hypothetical protein